MVDDAAIRFRTLPIPMPHVTALYGIVMEEEEVLQIFREDVRRVLKYKAVERRRKVIEDNMDEKECLWPDLEALGILVDVEYDGVGNGTMVNNMYHYIVVHCSTTANVPIYNPSTSFERIWHGQR